MQAGMLPCKAVHLGDTGALTHYPSCSSGFCEGLYQIASLPSIGKSSLSREDGLTFENGKRDREELHGRLHKSGEVLRVSYDVRLGSGCLRT